MSEPDPEKVKREEERLLRAMSKQKKQMPVFGKQVSTDTMKKQKEEEERKKKEQEQKIAKQREDLERKRLEAEKREAAAAAAAATAAAPAPVQHVPEVVRQAPASETVLLEPDRAALEKEERRLQRISSATLKEGGEVKQQAQPASSLQAHLRLLQEKQQKIDEEKSSTSSTSHSTPAHSVPPVATSVVHTTPAPAPTPALAPVISPRQVSPRQVSPRVVSPRAAPTTASSHPEKVVSPRGASGPPIVSPRPNQTQTKAAEGKADDTHFPPPGPPSIGGPFEVQVLDEINEVRRNPQKYAEYLRTLATSFDGLVFAVPGTRFVRQTKEGVAALNEAASFLASQNPLETLRPIENLSKVSRDLVEDDSKGTLPQTQAAAYERFSRYGKWEGEMAEMISYGGVSAKEVVLQWLLDDGDSERRDRRSIMQSTFRVIGISSGHHATFGRICVATLTSDYKDPNAASSEVKEVASQLAKVSLIKEEDGHVIIDGGHAPGDKSLYRLVKRGKRLTLQNAEINRSWDLPFDFQKESVTARFDANNNLTIEIVKGSENQEESGVVLISSFPVAAAPGAGPKVQLGVRQDSESIYVDIKPSQFEEEVFIRTRGNAVEIESKHTEIEETAEQTYKKAITSVQTLQLPFKPVGITVHNEPGTQASVIISKKVTLTPRQFAEEDIPISF